MKSSHSKIIINAMLWGVKKPSSLPEHLFAFFTKIPTWKAHDVFQETVAYFYLFSLTFK